MKKERVRFLSHLILAAVRNRFSRFLLVVAALTLASTLAVSLVAISLGVEKRLGESLRLFGANLLLLPQSQRVGSGELALGELRQSLPQGEVEEVLAQTEGVEEYRPRLKREVKLVDRAVLLIGLTLEEMRSAKWRLEGELPQTGEVLIGRDLANELGLEKGGDLKLGDGYRVAGVVETGGEEDGAVLIELGEALKVFGGGVNYYLVRTSPGESESVKQAIENALPGVKAETLRQVAQAEEDLLDKVKLLLAIVTLGVVLSAAIAVGNTLNIVVLERSEEIGLLKAIGATSGFIVTYFFLEALLMAVLGGLLGLVVGWPAAQAVSFSAFGKFIPVSLEVFPTSFAVSLLIILLAGVIPVYRASRVDASATLKGL